MLLHVTMLCAKDPILPKYFIFTYFAIIREMHTFTYVHAHITLYMFNLDANIILFPLFVMHISGFDLVPGEESHNSIVNTFLTTEPEAKISSCLAALLQQIYLYAQNQDL